MVEKIENWNNTCDRFVAFLDILGFKNMIFRNEHEKNLDTMGKFSQDIIKKIENSAKKYRDKKDVSCVRPSSSRIPFCSSQATIPKTQRCC